MQIVSTIWIEGLLAVKEVDNKQFKQKLDQHAH